MKIIFSSACLRYQSPGHPEGPGRVSKAYEFLKQKGFEFVPATKCKEEDILLVHSPALLYKIKTAQFSDTDTPNISGIFDYACLSAGAAIQAQEICFSEKVNAFSLMRPPGHHASRDNLGGFCYFNNIAIAMKKALAKIKKAAILDLDCHHGNGTQDIFNGQKDLLYVSLHQSPLYPGTGLKSERNCLNYPLPAGTDERLYLATLTEALKKVKDFQPDILGISLGVDTYKDDPLTDLDLEISTYRRIGLMIKELTLPSFAVLEGGYSSEVAQCLYGFILGWDGESSLLI